MGFIVNDPTIDPATDETIIAFDPNLNGGDPDSPDRLFRISRAGISEESAGIGTNLDGALWDPNYTSEHWQIAMGDVSNERWVFELSIDISQEMPLLLAGNPFGFMLYSGFTDGVATWPTAGDPNNPDSWTSLENTICP
jgi:hypothetical protein